MGVSEYWETRKNIETIYSVIFVWEPLYSLISPVGKLALEYGVGKFSIASISLT